MGIVVVMPAGTTSDLAQRIASEAALLPIDKQGSVLDFVMFVKHQAEIEREDGDAAWERIIADPKPWPKLEAYLRSIESEPTEPLDFKRQ